MRNALAILLIISLAGGILYYVVRVVPQWNKGANKPWTSERIGRGPDEFIKYADRELFEAVRSFEDHKKELAQRKEDTLQQITQLHSTTERAIAKFEVLRKAYRHAAENHTWPVRISGSIYPQKVLEDEIVTCDGELTRLDKNANQLVESLHAVNEELRELDERITSATQTSVDVRKILANYKAKPTLSKLAEIWLKMQDVTGQGMAESPSPTEGLIREVQEDNAEGDRLREAMKRKIEGPREPMIPSPNESVATTAPARPPSQDVVPTPTVTPAVRPPLEEAPPTRAVPVPAKPPLATAPPTAAITAPARLPLNEAVPTARLEVFTLANDSSGRWSPQPVIKTYWKGDLRCSGTFLLPDLVSHVGLGRRYWAKFSFHFEAKQPGTYEFTVQHNRMNDCFLRYLGVDVVKSEGQAPHFLGRSSGITGKGVCRLEEGPNRFEFWLLSNAERPAGRGGSAVFEVKVLTPGASGAVPITADVMRP
jgi:prefoldin subunit 5